MLCFLTHWFPAVADDMKGYVFPWIIPFPFFPLLHLLCPLPLSPARSPSFKYPLFLFFFVYHYLRFLFSIFPSRSDSLKEGLSQDIFPNSCYTYPLRPLDSTTPAHWLDDFFPPSSMFPILFFFLPYFPAPHILTVLFFLLVLVL